MTSPRADDYYALLGVSEDADDETLRRAWRQLSEAYAVLSDPSARAAYDRRRGAAGPESTRAPASATSAPSRAARPPAPAVMLSRLTGPLSTLLTCGAARIDDLDDPGFITLVLREDEAAQGGMATVSMPVDLWCPGCASRERSAGCTRCGGRRRVEEFFSAWLAVPPGVTAGEVLVPSVELPGMVEPVRFRVRIHRKK